MTLEELRVLVADIKTKSRAIRDAALSLDQMIVAIDAQINNEYASTINVDAFVAIQTPIYLERLTALEAATDALGTDALH